MTARSLEALLRSCPLFSFCAEETLRFVQNSGQRAVIDYEPGEKVRFPQPAIAILAKGKLRVGGRSDLKKLVISQMERGAAFGYATLFEEGGRFETDVYAQTKATVLFLPETLVEQLLRVDAGFARSVIAAQSEKIRFLNRKILSYTAPDNREKLLRYLRGLPSREGAISLPVGMAPLAARLGMGRASLYRAMKALEQEGILRKDNDTIILTDER